MNSWNPLYTIITTKKQPRRYYNVKDIKERIEKEEILIVKNGLKYRGIPIDSDHDQLRIKRNDGVTFTFNGTIMPEPLRIGKNLYPSELPTYLVLNVEDIYSITYDANRRRLLKPFRG